MLSILTKNETTKGHRKLGEASDTIYYLDDSDAVRMYAYVETHQVIPMKRCML